MQSFHFHRTSVLHSALASSLLAVWHIVRSNCLYCIWQVYGEDEWSFGFCEQGSGVFSCPSGKNPMYTYRESIVLGTTDCSIFKVNQILRELSREWPGFCYDLLSKNCNHFCDELCERLGVPKLPGNNIVRLVVYKSFLSLNAYAVWLGDYLTDH